MKKIIKEGKKPILKFTCDLCGTQIHSDDYKIKEHQRFPGMLISSAIESLPMDKCPTCSMPMTKSVKVKEGDSNEKQ